MMQTHDTDQTAIAQLAADIPELVLSVLRRVRQSRRQAYITGGAVRDLLLGRRPTDFDIATNMSVAELRQVLPRLQYGSAIGIARVEHDGLSVDITPFQNQQRGVMIPRTVDRHLRAIYLDALARDFSINCIYFDPFALTVIDFFGGQDDIRDRTIRTIGDPTSRFAQSPRMMMRAIRLAHTLDFDIDPAVVAGFPPDPGTHFAKERYDRLLIEFLKHLGSGHAVECVRSLHASGMLTALMPTLSAFDDKGTGYIEFVLGQVDELVAGGGSLSPAVLFSALLWPQVHGRTHQQDAMTLASVGAAVLADCSPHLAIADKFGEAIIAIWMTQAVFEKPGGPAALSLSTSPHFRAGYNLFVLRADFYGNHKELTAWWEHLYHSAALEREAMCDQLP